MSRKFGVELEMKGISENKALAALAAVGITAHSEGYNHTTRGHWKIVPDSSVGSGFEVVSPVLEGEAGLESLRTVVSALKDAGGKVDRRCGMHVHFDAAGLDVSAVRNIVKTYAAFETQIDGFMPPSRRGNANNYCRSLSSVVSNRQFQTAITLQGLAQAQGGRYFKINLQSYQVHGTIEFRQHSGTLDAPKAVNWVRFLAAFIEANQAPTVAPEAAISPAAPALSGAQGRLATMLTASGFLHRHEIAAAFGWQDHTVRAAVTRLRQAGLAIVAEKRDGRPGYRLATQAAPVATTPTDLFRGIPADLVTFYRNRAAVLALN